METTEYDLYVALFNMLYKVVLTFKSVDETLVCDHSNESYIKQFFRVILFNILYKVVLTFKSVNKTLVCYPVHGGSNFYLCG